MNKSELVAAVAEQAGLSKVDAKKALDATLATITAELKKGNKVPLIGFGTFEVANVAERKGKNPRTGEALTIKAHKAPKFKAGAELKEAVK